MAKESLRTPAIYCLAIWVAVWLLFPLVRLSPLDILVIPGAGGVMLIALAAAFLAPLVATALARATDLGERRTRRFTRRLFGAAPPQQSDARDAQQHSQRVQNRRRQPVPHPTVDDRVPWFGGRVQHRH